VGKARHQKQIDRLKETMSNWGGGLKKFVWVSYLPLVGLFGPLSGQLGQNLWQYAFYT